MGDVEMVACDDGPVEEEDPHGTVEKDNTADDPARNKDDVDIPDENKDSTDEPVENKVASDEPVENNDAVDVSVENIDAAVCSIENSNAGDEPVENNIAAVDPVENIDAADEPFENIEAADENNDADKGAVESNVAADEPVENNEVANNQIAEKALNCDETSEIQENEKSNEISRSNTGYSSEIFETKDKLVESPNKISNGLESEEGSNEIAHVNETHNNTEELDKEIEHEAEEDSSDITEPHIENVEEIIIGEEGPIQDEEVEEILCDDGPVDNQDAEEILYDDGPIENDDAEEILCDDGPDNTMLVDELHATQIENSHPTDIEMEEDQIEEAECSADISKIEDNNNEEAQEKHTETLKEIRDVSTTESVGSREISNEKHSEIEDNCIATAQYESGDVPMNGCMDMSDALSIEEDPIKITDDIKSQNKHKLSSSSMGDIIEIHSDNEDDCMDITDDIGSLQKVGDDLITDAENCKEADTNVADPNQSKFKFKKRLIKQVRKQTSLYDTRSKGFTNLDTKMVAWEKIAFKLKKDVEFCKQTWVDLRFDYQRYVRKLRKFLRSANPNKKRRPVMLFERELLFLWRFVADQSRYPDIDSLKNKIDTAAINFAEAEDDDVVLVEGEPVVVINLEDNDSDEELTVPKNRNSKNDCTITPELRKLVALLKEYPELYDISHRYYNDYGRKGIIWSSLANELKDKATKLMKLWIYAQARFEWEINSITEKTELQELLEFIKPYTIMDQNSVYKQSLYLRGKTWQEPIEAFKIIFQLLATLRKYPQLIDTILTKKSDAFTIFEYKREWTEIGELRGFPPGQCEVTWLIMRNFYWELMNMRKNNYQLQDKWYFESIISELYTHIPVKNPPTKESVIKDVHANSYAYSERIIDPPPQPPPQPQPISVKSFANTSKVLPKKQPTITVDSLIAKQFARKATKAAAPKAIPKSISPKAIPPKALPIVSQAVAPAPVISKPTASTQLTNPNIVALPRHAAPLAFNREIATPTSPAMVSIDISSSPPSSPPPLAPMSAQGSTVNNIQVIPSGSEALSSNEILIELVSSSNGNMLIINEATKKYALNMITTAKFIREVMAIPFLHNKSLPQSAKQNHWVFIANRFQLPDHIAIACWDFLLENFQHFDQICPMEKLMAPFPNFKVWKENVKPFQNFHSYAVKKGWTTYMKSLPMLMVEMSKHPELYDDALAKTIFSLPSSITSKFPNIPPMQITEICTAFKNAFVSYMKDLEQGIANKWPEQWWHVLEKLKFLVDVRYHKYEPFYYIIKNKINEEITRHLELERLVREAKANKIPNQSMQIKNDGKAISKASVTLTPDQACQMSLCEEKPKPYRIRHNLDPYSLILAIRRHPNVYENCSSQEKLEAWTQVALEMNTTVAECRANFQRVFREYRLYIHRDPAARCRLNHKYFRHMKDIYRAVKHPTTNKLSIKTPTELNESLLQSNETVFPERFIVDINMGNSKPALVMKNWSYAIGNLHVYTQDSMQSVLRSVFNKYRNQSAAT